MPDIFYATNAYRRDNGNLPELKCLNMYVEETPTSETQVSINSRQGLLLVTTVGSGPIRAMFSQEGTFNGDLFVVSGTSVYRGSTLIGTLVGNGEVSIAASASEVVFTAGGPPKSYNGTNFATIAMPDGRGSTAVGYISHLFVFLQEIYGRFYWSAIDNARSVDALDYASEEAAPDGLLDVKVWRGTMYILGVATIAPWYPTADPDLPFTRMNQQVYDVGVLDTNCCAIMDNSLYWLGNDGVVYRADDVPKRVSDYSIEERIFASSTAPTCYGFTFEGHKFFVVQLGHFVSVEGTYLYDIATGQWCQWQSFGLTRWRIDCALQVGRTALFGDYSNGRIWELNGRYDDTSTKIERVFTAYFPIKGGEVNVDNLSLVCNAGHTSVSVGSGSAPVVQIRASRDAGNTWGSWRSVALGALNKFRTRVISRIWGKFDAPGGMFEIKNDDPVPFRVSGVLVNEHGGGRSR